MIKVSKEILAYTGIEHSYITGDQNAFCVPVKMGARRWILAVDSALKDGWALLHIKRYDVYLEIEVYLKKERGMYYSAALPHSHALAPLSQALIDDIKTLERKHEHSGGGEARQYEVSLNSFDSFGFAGPEQKMIIGAYQAPCLINNISRGGITFTTFMHIHLKESAALKLELQFKSPFETIEITGLIRHVFLRGGSGAVKFAVVSISISSSPHAYQKRLEAFAREHQNEECRGIC